MVVKHVSVVGLAQLALGLTSLATVNYIQATSTLANCGCMRSEQNDLHEPDMNI